MIKIKQVKNIIVKEKYKFPCIDCVVRPICDFTKPCDKLEMDDETVKDLFLEHKCCPDCGSEKFHEGPSGGMSTNTRCHGCSHWFNMGLPLLLKGYTHHDWNLSR